MNKTTLEKANCLLRNIEYYEKIVDALNNNDYDCYEVAGKYQGDCSTDYIFSVEKDEELDEIIKKWFENKLDTMKKEFEKL